MRQQGTRVNSRPLRRTFLGGKKARPGGRRRVALMSGVTRDAQGDVVPCGGAVAALGGITALPLRTLSGTRDASQPKVWPTTPSRVAASHCRRVCTTALERRRSLAFL